jgi:hypothetical protein
MQRLPALFAAAAAFVLASLPPAAPASAQSPTAQQLSRPALDSIFPLAERQA